MPAPRVPRRAMALSVKRHLSTAAASSASPRRRLLRSLLLGSRSGPSSRASPSPARVSQARPPAQPQSLTTLPEAHPRNLPEVWFNATFPVRSVGPGGGDPNPGGKPPDERTVKLGKTLRILQERLPTLLQSPLPSEILSPNISLHLFPSTHPHLPVVSGRVAYVAALWTSPLAWNRVPLVGSVQLEILSERMTTCGRHHSSPRRAGAGDEQLVVRWRTVSKELPFLSSILSKSSSSGGDSTKSSSRGAVGTSQAVDDPKEFTGLFIFEFDQEGRILSHTIEHVEEGGDWERSVGARFVGLTDWLLRGIKGQAGGASGSGNGPLPAFELQDPQKMR